jgi:CubicO group peptidase (beta-lactamase class C family)
MVLGTISSALSAQQTSLPRSAPEAQGISSTAIIEFIQAADRQVDSMHSFMLVRHGQVVAEAWWNPQTAETSHVMWSLSKSFTSTAVGLAIADGKLKLDDPVIKFFPNETPVEPSANLQAMRVRDLLTMTTGHEEELNLRVETEWVKAFLAQPVPHQPGTFFKYNTPATYLQSAIVQQVTGQTVVEYLKPRLFEPLGIKQPQWDASPQDISIGGFGLYLRTEDIAKFGQLYLQQGNWQGQQLIPADWVQLATAKQVSNGDGEPHDWNQGYGFQFWRCRHNAYRGDGKDGQFCIVLPAQDAVIAMTANTDDMGQQLQLVWGKLLPAFQEQALPENQKQVEKLKKLTGQLKETK